MRSCALVQRLQARWLRRVTSEQRETIRPALDHCRDEGGADRLVGHFDLVLARPQPVLDVGHHPGAAPRALAPAGAVAPVDSLHRALAIVKRVDHYNAGCCFDYGNAEI